MEFKNRAPTSCSPGPILWPPTISFEVHAEMAKEIDLEKCTFRNFGSSVTLTFMVSIAVSKMGMINWSLWTMEWKSMASITTMLYSISRCCQRSSVLQAIQLSFNKTMLHLTMPKTPLNCYSKKRGLRWSWSLAIKQPRPESSGL